MLNLVVVTQMSTFVRTHWTLRIKRVNITVYKLNLNKFDFKNKDKDKTLKICREKHLFSNKQDSGIFSMLKENNC